MGLSHGLWSVRLHACAAVTAPDQTAAEVKVRGRLFTRDKNVLKSQVKQNSKHPRWNEEFKLLVHEPDYQVGPARSCTPASAPAACEAAACSAPHTHLHCP